MPPGRIPMLNLLGYTWPELPVCLVGSCWLGEDCLLWLGFHVSRDHWLFKKLLLFLSISYMRIVFASFHPTLFPPTPISLAH